MHVEERDMTGGRLLLIVFLLGATAPLTACVKSNAGAPTSFCTRCAVVESVVSRPVFMERRVVYDVTVRMDHGGRRLLTFDQPPNLRAGDRVRLSGDKVERG
jgi:hypothetical protein